MLNFNDLQQLFGCSWNDLVVSRERVNGYDVCILMQARGFRDLPVLAFLRVVRDSNVRYVQFVNVRYILPRAPAKRARGRVRPTCYQVRFIGRMNVFYLVLAFGRPFTPVKLLFAVGGSRSYAFVTLGVFVVCGRATRFLPPLECNACLCRLQRIQGPVLRLLPSSITHLVRLSDDASDR